MDTNNWRPPQVGEAPMDAGDWRNQLQPDSRQRIVNKIMDTLKRHLPFSGHEGLQELKKIAVRFEEKIYTAATSQSDYLRKISLKMLTMETKSQNTMANSLQSNSAGNSNRPHDPGSFGMQPQVPNQGQSLSMPLPANQPVARQQLLSQNIQNNIPAAGVQSSAGLSSALPPSSGLTQTSIPSIVGQNQNMQNMGQGVPSNMFATSQRQLPGRQQVVPQQQQQQSQNSQQYMYQQLQHPQSNMTSLQQSSMSALSGVSTAQQNMMNSLPPSSSMDSGQGNALNSLQQVPVGSNQQTPVSAPQQANMNALSSQSGVNMLQANMNSIQSNSGMLQHQHLKQQQEHQMFQNQLKQQFQHRQMQQQLMQKQQLLQHQQQQQQQLLQHQQQQQQQLQLQAKQQLPAQLQAHQQQMPQLHQMNDVNDLKMRQGMGVKPGVFQQHLSVDGWFVMQTGFLFVCLLLWCYTFFG